MYGIGVCWTFSVTAQWKCTCVYVAVSDSEKERVATMTSRVADVEALNDELRADMDACSKREAEHLEFTRRVSDKNATVQSEHSSLRQKLSQLEDEHRLLGERFTALTAAHSTTVSQSA